MSARSCRIFLSIYNLSSNNSLAKMGRCCVLNCSNQTDKKLPDVSFHKFPIRSQRQRKAWIVNCFGSLDDIVWEPSRHSRVCSDHFRDEDYKPGSGRTALRPMLKPFAVPTIFSLTEGRTIKAVEELDPLDLEIEQELDEIDDDHLIDHNYVLNRSDKELKEELNAMMERYLEVKDQLRSVRKKLKLARNNLHQNVFN